MPRSLLLCLLALSLLACGGGTALPPATPLPNDPAAGPSAVVVAGATRDANAPLPPERAALATAVRPGMAALLATAIANPTLQARAGTVLPSYGFRVIAEYPHDRSAYTQGLLWDEGALYESTGLLGQSTVRRVALETGAVLQQQALPADQFGEGLALLGDRLVQLTWQSQVAYLYDKATLQPLGSWSYPTEGWGLVFDGNHLVMSDGSATLRFRDPESFEVVREVTVTALGEPVPLLNELEVVGGELWANIYQSDRIARIAPATGEVLGWIELAGLLPPAQRDGSEDVLNGIAYDAATGRLFVTGKLWPTLFEIEITPAP